MVEPMNLVVWCFLLLVIKVLAVLVHVVCVILNPGVHSGKVVDAEANLNYYVGQQHLVLETTPPLAQILFSCKVKGIRLKVMGDSFGRHK